MKYSLAGNFKLFFFLLGWGCGAENRLRTWEGRHCSNNQSVTLTLTLTTTLTLTNPQTFFNPRCYTLDDPLFKQTPLPHRVCPNQLLVFGGGGAVRLIAPRSFIQDTDMDVWEKTKLKMDREQKELVAQFDVCPCAPLAPLCRCGGGGGGHPAVPPRYALCAPLPLQEATRLRDQAQAQYRAAVRRPGNLPAGFGSGLSWGGGALPEKGGGGQVGRCTKIFKCE